MVVSTVVGVVVGGACMAGTMGFGTGACVAMGMAAAGLTYSALELAFGGSRGGDSDSGATITYERQANGTTVKNDDDELNKVIDDANQQTYEGIAELTAKLRSDLVRYDTKEDGATGDLWIEIYAPSKIYGFSAFPVQAKLYTKESNIPFNVIHLRSVEIYLQKENSSVPLWKRVWDYGTGSEGLNGQSVVYSTILKVPDDWVYQVQNAIQTGQVTRDLIEQIFSANTSTWEIFVKVDAYREVWQNDPQYTDQSSCTAQPNHKWDSNTSTCYVFVRNDDIKYTAYTTSAWRHVSMAHDIADLADGFYASLPVKFLNTEASTKWALYQEKYAGALSNFIILTFATPVHVIGSTADYKFYIVPNPGYFEPLNPSFNDDFRFVAVREYKDLSWTVADSIFGNLGTMSPDTPTQKLLTAHYTEDLSTLTYKVYGLAYFTITRDDNITIPLWLVVNPKVSVIPNTRTVLADNQIDQLVQFTDDGKLEASEINQTKAIAASLINGLQEKITAAEDLKKKADAEGNEKASLYAEKAIQAYQDAIEALNKITQTDAVQEYLNWLNVAKKLEQAGDFYMSAAEKALYGEYEQAELDAQKGDELSQLADEYKPHIDILTTAKSMLSKKILGIPLWALLAIVFVLVGAFVVWRKLL
ncbi:hypothetical protein [Thermococcus kodakarensis]|nr:hypothetical protein [Thermococcus kodakarensis]WCN28457.1 hypothetical protein POG15_01975 [Thermococcus kodakarensis]WCN30753.1 hypothetical protein POG21_01975 [Thermococcus kodakarensis]